MVSNDNVPAKATSQDKQLYLLFIYGNAQCFVRSVNIS